MNFEFHASNPDCRPHFVLSEFGSLSSILAELNRLSAADAGSLHIKLDRPSIGDTSIPRVFQILVEKFGRANSNRTIHVYVASDSVLEHLSRYLPYDIRMRKKFELSWADVTVTVGDIVSTQCEAIVNASNVHLKLGGGVSGAIRDSADPGLQEELFRIAARGTLVAGDAVVTGSYGIHGVKWIIHVATADGTRDGVRRAVQNVIAIAFERGINTVAIPALGTGTGGLHVADFAELTVQVLTSIERPSGARRLQLHIVLWTTGDYQTVCSVLSGLLT